MTPEQTELLVRVDQNVINLSDLVHTHITEDKEFHKFVYTELQPLKTAHFERQGAQKYVGAVYGVIGGLVTLVGTLFFPHGIGH